LRAFPTRKTPRRPRGMLRVRFCGHFQAARHRADRAKRCARALRVRFRPETRRADRAERCARVFARIFDAKNAAPTARNAARAFLRTFSSRKAPRRPRQTLRVLVVDGYKRQTFK